MDNNQKALSHFGVPGMRWGRRTANRYQAKAAKQLKKAAKYDAEGNKSAADRKRGNAEIFKNRAKNAKEIGKIGESIRKGTSLVDKLLGTDMNLMSMKLAKGKHTAGELAVSNILGGSRMTMNSLVSSKLVNG